MNTIKIKSTDEASQGPFVVIARADFNPDIHEALDPADLANADEQPRTLTTKGVAEARAELERKHDEVKRMYGEVVAERERLDAQAAEQEVERQCLATLAGDLETERTRLAEAAAAAKLATEPAASQAPAAPNAPAEPTAKPARANK